MKKILFVIGTMTNGGAERVISVLVTWFCKQGYEVSVTTIIDNKIDYPLDNRTHYYPLRFKGRGVQRNIERIRQLRSIMKRTQADVVVSFLSIINIATLIASIGLNKKIILSERNDPSKEPLGKLNRLIRNLLYSFLRCDNFVFQTHDAMIYFNKSIQNRSNVIPNPLSVLPDMYEGVRRKRIVTIARLEPQKNISLLIKCFYNICCRYPDYTLDIYGKGILLDELKMYTEMLGIGEKVIFHGFVKNLHEHIKDASIYVMSSNYEGISNGMLEALAMGIPVVATDCPIGGAKMYIEHGINGLLVPVGDEEKLTEALTAMIERPEYAESLGRRAINIRRDLSVENIGLMWKRVIDGGDVLQ